MSPEKLRDEDLRLAELLEQALAEARANGGYMLALEQALKLVQERNLLLLKARSPLLESVAVEEVDELTGLPNASAFNQALEQVFTSKEAFSVVAFDLDHFNQVNSQFSPGVGNEVLRRIGGLVGKSLRRGDVAGRLGGQTFGLILRGTTGDRAYGVCERLRMAVQKHDWNNLQEGLKVTISLGYADRGSYTSAQQVLDRANRFQLEAKNSGRNQTFPGSYY